MNPGPVNLCHVSDEVLEQEIAWATDQLAVMEMIDERDARWYIRTRALEGFARRFEQERDRRERVRQNLGGLNLETADPGQTMLWPAR